jgi:hypothetical protein
VTIADFEKENGGIVKISRQIPHKSDICYISPKVSRILQYIAQKSNNGCAILLGSYDATTTTTTSNPSIDSKLFVSTTSPKKVRIVGACELQFAKTDDLLSQYQEKSLKKIQTIAKACGLDIVGCCIGQGHTDTDIDTTGESSTTSSSWDVGHVFAALELKDMSPIPERFIVLSADLKGRGKSISKIVTKVSNKLQTLNDKLTIEPYYLSDQVINLHKKGMIVTKRQQNSTTIQLTEDVMVQSEMKKKVDPLLFAGPCSIRTLARNGQG